MPARDIDSATWTPAHSDLLYRVNGWGAPYFGINSNGNVTVRSNALSTLLHQEIDLLKVVKKAADPKTQNGLGLQLPIVIRFPDVLKNRLELINASFKIAINSTGYESHYQGVYPVKCNQDKFVVDDIVRFGSGFRFGLEAGSKPELLLAMTSLIDNGSVDGFLVCNGFKDVEYVRLALLGRKIGINTVIVLEQEEELDVVVDVSRRLGVRPVIGLRAKLRTKHAGHFGSTSGEKGKFGLTTGQIVNVVRKLRKLEMLECLELLHFHIGSQIPSTCLLADGVREAAQIYCELVRLGAGMKVIDIGGGLGIDYDGSKSEDSDVSVGYSVEEYALAVVEAVGGVCDRKGVKHPILCSESGRAIVSHHSVLVFEAVSASSYGCPQLSSAEVDHFVESLSGEALADYKSLSEAALNRDFDSCLVYAEKMKQRCVEKFKEGDFDIEQLAAVDGICDLVTKAIGVSDPVRTYHVNLSVFTSIPDFWGIGQLFPIIPIHKLDEKPTMRGILSDLTCDSDGKIDRFIGGESSLPLHELKGNGGLKGDGGSYYLGMFLGGAYEEALGGVHNLFGGPSVVRVFQSEGPHGFAVTRAVPGPSCGDVLRAMQYEPELMFQTLKHRVEEIDNDDELVNGIACSFNNMPYLAADCSVTASVAGNDMPYLAADCSVAGNKGFYCCSDETYASSTDSVVSEEEHWSY